MAKEILIPQQSFTAHSVGNWCASAIDDIAFKNEKIAVVFDGTTYECERLYIENMTDEHDEVIGWLCAYGAPFNSSISNYDFSVCPFNIEPQTSTYGTFVTVLVADTNEHTIEVCAAEKSALYQHSNVRTQDNQIFYFDENTGDFIFFDGDSWGQNNDAWGKGIVPPKSKVAVVGTAIVGTDVVGESSSGTALVDSAIVDTDVVGEEEEVVLIPETTFTTNEQGSYNFVGVEAFKYSQIKIVLNGEEKIVDGTKPGDTYVYIFSGSGPNDIGIATGTAMSKPIVSFFDSINQEPTTYTIKVIKITDEEILGSLPVDPQ